MSKLNSIFSNKVVRVMTDITESMEQGDGEYITGSRAYEGLFVDSDTSFIYLGVHEEDSHRISPVLAIKVDSVVAIETIGDEYDNTQIGGGTIN